MRTGEVVLYWYVGPYMGLSAPDVIVFLDLDLEVKEGQRVSRVFIVSGILLHVNTTI